MRDGNQIITGRPVVNRPRRCSRSRSSGDHTELRLQRAPRDQLLSLTHTRVKTRICGLGSVFPNYVIHRCHCSARSHREARNDGDWRFGGSLRMTQLGRKSKRARCSLYYSGFTSFCVLWFCLLFVVSIFDILFPVLQLHQDCL